MTDDARQAGVVDQLHVIDNETNDDGTVNAEIHKIDLPDDPGDSFEVEFLLPDGQTETEDYQWAERATDDYEIVRLCESVGFSLSQVRQLEGERVRWDDGVEYPEPETFADKASPPPSPYYLGWVRTFIIFPMFIITAPIAIWDRDGKARQFASAVLFSTLWTLAVCVGVWYVAGLIL